MIELVVRNMHHLVGSCRTIVVLREDMRQFESKLSLPDCELMYVPSLTQGAANTVDFALKNVDDDEELVVANSDQIVDFDRNDFEIAAQNYDGTIITFFNADKDPKWSYAIVDENGVAKRVAEKNPISHLATVGIYHYKTAKMLKKALQDMFASDDRTNGEFYLCPAYNHIFPSSRITTTSASMMYGIGTPEDLENSLSKRQFVKFIEFLKK